MSNFCDNSFPISYKFNRQFNPIIFRQVKCRNLSPCFCPDRIDSKMVVEMITPLTQLEEYLKEVKYPAGKEEILNYAIKNNADPNILVILEQLPSRLYKNLTEAISSFEKEKKPLNQVVEVEMDNIKLPGKVLTPAEVKSVVIFSHGIGGTVFNPTSDYLAKKLFEAGIGTFMFNILAEEEEPFHNVNDLDFITHRLIAAINWFKSYHKIHYPLGILGDSVGSVAAVSAAAILQEDIKAFVSIGGLPDFTFHLLPDVKAPTFLIVNSHDFYEVGHNEIAMELLPVAKKLIVIDHSPDVSKATEKFREVAAEIVQWFKEYLEVRKDENV